MKKFRNKIFIYFVLTAIMFTCFSCKTFNKAVAEGKRKAWVIGQFTDNPNVSYLLYDGSVAILSTREYSSPPYIREFSRITSLVFSEAGLTFITSNITSNDGRALVEIIYHRSTASEPIQKMSFNTTLRNASTTGWRVTINYSEELLNFILNMPERFHSGGYITVTGNLGSFKFDFPNIEVFKTKYQELIE